jgi:hypothetical protein
MTVVSDAHEIYVDVVAVVQTRISALGDSARRLSEKIKGSAYCTRSTAGIISDIDNLLEHPLSDSFELVLDSVRSRIAAVFLISPSVPCPSGVRESLSHLESKLERRMDRDRFERAREGLRRALHMHGAGLVTGEDAMSMMRGTVTSLAGVF